MQNLNQSEVYVSSREGEILVSSMSVPHAQRTLGKLVREHGPEVVETPLGKALTDRARIQGEATDVVSISGGSRMIRGEGGKFVGAWSKELKRP